MEILRIIDLSGKILMNVDAPIKNERIILKAHAQNMFILTGELNNKLFSKLFRKH